MIVCSCSGVSDGEVRACARRGDRSLADLARTCGAGGDCGACCDKLRRLLAESERSADGARDEASGEAGRKSL